MNRLQVEALLQAALQEDIGAGDVTTQLLAEANDPARGTLVARQVGILCGGGIAARCFTLIDIGIEPHLLLEDGAELKDGSRIGTIHGPAAGLLAAERVALNFIQRLSGIATLTCRLAERAAPHGIRIVETRKTTPGLRALEKYAVRIGGGHNHRFDLAGAVLLKDNHFALSRMRPGELVRHAREQASHALSVIAEAGEPSMVEEIAAAGPNVILLDNFSPDEVRWAVQAVAGRCLIEVSGGVTERNLDAYLMPGVDVISIGALTHSPPALDISFELG